MNRMTGGCGIIQMKMAIGVIFMYVTLVAYTVTDRKPKIDVKADNEDNSK